MILGHSLPQKGNCEITLNYFLLCVILWVPYSFWELDCSPAEKIVFGNPSHEWKDNIEMYFEELVFEYMDCFSVALDGVH